MTNDASSANRDIEPLHPLDAMSAAPEHHTVLLENDSVRVLDTRLGPGQRTPIHTHQWPAVLYVMAWSEFVRYDVAGNVLVDSRTLPSRTCASTNVTHLTVSRTSWSRTSMPEVSGRRGCGSSWSGLTMTPAAALSISFSA